MPINYKYLLKLSLVATLGGLLFGYDTAVISGAVGSLEHFFILPFGLDETAANSRLGFVVSSALIGCILGGISSGIVSKVMGRRNGLILASLLFLISAVGSAVPEMFIRPIGEGDHTFIYAFVVYRIIGGIGVGLASMLSPLYIAEIAPAKIRGKLVSINQLAIIFGMLAVYFVNYYIAGRGDNTWLNKVGWRWMFASEALPAFIFLSFLFFVPDTPRSLVLNDKAGEALKVLTKLNGITEAEKIMGDIQRTVVHRSRKLFSYGKLVVLIGILLCVFQQLIGINVVLYYAPEIFKNMGAGTESSLFQTIIVGVVNLLFSVFAILTVDKLGRKPLMVAGALGMALSMFALGGVFYCKSVGFLALLSILFYVGSFAMSWGPVTWVLVSEIFPNKIRGKAMAISTASIWIANYLVSWTFPLLDKNSFLIERFNHGFTYWVYGTICILAMLFVWKFVPETKGMTLEEMENLWVSEINRSNSKKFIS